MKIHFRFLFGLKYKRFIAWCKDIWIEKPGIKELFLMSRMAIRALISPIPKHVYLQRLTICEHCLIFNHATKACRNGERGCGCYVPYKALARVQCWLQEQNAAEGWGAIK